MGTKKEQAKEGNLEGASEEKDWKGLREVFCLCTLRVPGHSAGHSNSLSALNL